MSHTVVRRRLAAIAVTALLAGALVSAATPAQAASVAGTAQANAQALLDSGRMTFGSASTQSQVQAYASGFEYVNPRTGRACNINDVLLDALRKVVVDQGFSIRIISLNRWCEGSEPTAWWQYHIVNGGGHAVDIIRVNGVPSTGATSQDVAFVRALTNVLPAPAGVGQQNCGQVLTVPSGWTRFNDTCDHLHVEYRGADTPVPAPAASVSTVAVHRFWSPVYRGHFYTSSEAEKDYVIATLSHLWTYEGVAYSAFTGPVEGTIPLYRFWSAQYSGHFYTADRAERDYVEATMPGLWKYEGVAYYVYPGTTTRTDTVSVQRFWSTTVRHHFYTASEDEKNYVIATWPDLWGYEGVAFKVPAIPGPRSVTSLSAPSAPPEPPASDSTARTASPETSPTPSVEPDDISDPTTTVTPSPTTTAPSSQTETPAPPEDDNAQ